MDAAASYGKTIGSEVTAVALGDKTQTSVLSSSGADRNVLFADKDFEGSDIGAQARMVVAYVAKRDAVVFCGDPVLSGYFSGMAGIPHLKGLHRLDSRRGTFLNDGYSFSAEIEGPCAVSVGESYAGPKRKGKDSIVSVMGRVDLGLGFYSVGEKGSMTYSEAGGGGKKEPADIAASFLGAV